jgi:hypothetical protein
MSSPRPPVTFVHVGSGRGPATNVPTRPVLGTPQAGISPVAAGSTPYEQIDHTVGPKPRIVYQLGAVDGTPAVSIGDIHNPLSSPAMTIDPASTSDIGALGSQSGDVDGIGHQVDGTRVDLTTPPDDIPLPIKLPGLADTPPEPPTTSLPATSAVAGEVPWQAEEPGRIPKKYATPCAAPSASTESSRQVVTSTNCWTNA